MVNGGRLGEPTRAANLNNTLTINGENHDARIGGGVVEGFTSDWLDYASGFSGPALSSAQHIRNMVLVHGTDIANAYCIIFDEVSANSGDEVKNYLHPANQTSVSAIAAGMEYEAAIDHYATVNGVKLTFFYATPPAVVNIEKVQSAVQDRYPVYPEHNRLESVYEVNSEGNVNLTTVLFPHNASHPKPQMSRITEPGLTGSNIDHGGGLHDIILESFGNQEFSYDNFTFYGKSMVSRSLNSINVFYFVRHGKKLDQYGLGFDSDTLISIYTKGNEGVIVSHGAIVNLKGAGMESIQFDSSVEILNSGVDFIEVQLPEGKFYFNK